jgi:hypothetical protein
MYPVRIARVMALTFVASALAACAALNVGSFVERGIDFSQYHTFTWAPSEQLATGDPRLDNNEFFQRRVRSAVDRELAAKGLEPAGPGASDLVVHYHASVTQRIDANGADQQYGYCEDCRPSVFDAGTLTIDFVDARTNRLVWRGWAEGSIEGVIDNQAWMERQVDEAVTRILKAFTPGSRRL